MAYVGTHAPIPLGQLGLVTDEPQSQLPPNAASKANNVSLTGGKLIKSPGSAKYSATALEAAVVAVHDWWPSTTSQRLVAATANGKLWKDTGDGTWSTAAPIYNPGSTTFDNSCHFVAGGAEAAGNNRKLFFFSGTKQVQVLSGDGSSTANISDPAADWTNYPTFGIIYQGRLMAFGNSNQRHTVYVSTLADHEDFATTSGGPTAGNAGFYPVFTGEGDGIVSAYVYKGLLLLFKKPFGVYVFDWRDTSADPLISRFSDSFGIGAPHAACIAESDLLGLANTNSIFSLEASDKLGSLENGDVFKNMRVRNYMRENLSASGAQYSHAVYYPGKEQALFTARSNSGSEQDRIIVIDMSREAPRVTIETKDQPTCLALRRDSNYVPTPIYGNNDGYVMLMDDATRAVGGQPYTGEFQTPAIDFSYLDQGLAVRSKLFDFLSVSYTSSGTWNFYIDVYCDSEFVETLTFGQVTGNVLGSFELDVDTLGEYTSRTVRKPLHCMGKTISFRIYNTLVNEYFNVEKLVVGFRVSGDQLYGSR